MKKANGGRSQAGMITIIMINRLYTIGKYRFVIGSRLTQNESALQNTSIVNRIAIFRPYLLGSR